MIADVIFEMDKTFVVSPKFQMQYLIIYYTDKCKDDFLLNLTDIPSHSGLQRDSFPMINTKRYNDGIYSDAINNRCFGSDEYGGF